MTEVNDTQMDTALSQGIETPLAASPPLDLPPAGSDANINTTGHDASAAAAASDVPPNSPPNDAGDANMPNRRRSGRQRVSTVLYRGDPLPETKPRPKSKSKRKSEGTTNGEAKKNKVDGDSAETNGNGQAKGATGTPSSSTSKAAAKPKDEFADLPKKANPPTFVKLYTTVPSEILWARLRIRDFFNRFPDLCKVSNKHLAVINDPTSEWTDALYKAVVSAVFRIVFNDLKPVIPYDRAFMGEIERAPAGADLLWELVHEFLHRIELKRLQDQVNLRRHRRRTLDMYHSAVEALSMAQENEDDAEDNRLSEDEGEEEVLTVEQKPFLPLSTCKGAKRREEYQQNYVSELLLITLTTETIRLTLQEDQEIYRKLAFDTQEKIRRIKADWKAQEAHLNKSKPNLAKPQVHATNMERWYMKYDTQRVAYEQRLRDTETEAYATERRCLPGNYCIGQDVIGNKYWLFQGRADGGAGAVWCTGIVVEKDPKHPNPLGRSTIMHQGVQVVLDEAKMAATESGAKPLPNKNTTLFYVTGQENLFKLADWIRVQGHALKRKPRPKKEQKPIMLSFKYGRIKAQVEGNGFDNGVASAVSDPVANGVNDVNDTNGTNGVNGIVNLSGASDLDPALEGASSADSPKSAQSVDPPKIGSPKDSNLVQVKMETASETSEPMDEEVMHTRLRSLLAMASTIQRYAEHI